MSMADTATGQSRAARLLDSIRSFPAGRRVAIMEFCGGHTVAMFRHGIRSLMPGNVRLLSGPGCPVCVTADADIDLAVSLARTPGVMLATYGDMIRVPGSGPSLADVRAEGFPVHVVYSTLDALELARTNPEREVVFFAVGFETSAPAAAASVLAARAQGIRNYSLCSVMKLTAPGARALLAAGEVCVDAVLGPGHVATVTGVDAWRFLPEEHGIPVVLSGFEALDILASLDALLALLRKGRAAVVNGYGRVVKSDGNRKARAAMDRVFDAADADWRGFGTLPVSGLVLRDEFADFDALQRLGVKRVAVAHNPVCRCGEVLRAVIDPPECAAFGAACTPDRPLGPCMVSAEGVCAAWNEFAVKN